MKVLHISAQLFLRDACCAGTFVQFALGVDKHLLSQIVATKLVGELQIENINA